MSIVSVVGIVQRPRRRQDDDLAPDPEAWRVVRVLVQDPRDTRDVAIDDVLALVGVVGVHEPGDLVEAWGVVETNPRHGVQMRVVGPAVALDAPHATAGRDGDHALATPPKPSGDVLAAYRALAGLELTIADAQRVFRALGDTTERALEQDPYVLSSPRVGLAFTLADRVGRARKVKPTDPRRLRALAADALRQAASQGHIWSGLHHLARTTTATGELREGLDLAEKAGWVERLAEPPRLAASRWLATAERNTAQAIRQLASCEVRPLDIPLGAFTPIAPSDEQLDAVTRALAATSAVFVITGKPGSGKTSITRAIVKAWDAAGLRFALVAPTGRAAVRLAEATGHPASTIHSRFGINDDEDDNAPAGAAEVPPQAVLADEASMISLPLMDRLLAQLHTGTRLVLVGDADQLPPVGPGQPFSDLVRWAGIPTARLTRIYRQPSESMVPYLARDVIRGVVPGDNRYTADVRFVTVAEEAVPEAVVRLASQVLPAQLGPSGRGLIQSWMDVQVLSPMRKGPCGVNALNEALQATLNPVVARAGAARVRHGLYAHPGDRVIHKRNDRTKGLVNGDMGVVVRAAKATLTVRYDGRDVVYTKQDECDDVELCFASTVHSAQGGQYPVVVIPIVEAHGFFASRRLIYTALTRAQLALVLVGSKDAMARAVHNSRDEMRRTRLVEELKL